MKKTGKSISFTLIELLIVISIIAILAGLLLPALKNAKDKGKEMTCGNQQKQIFSGMMMYEIDYNGYLPKGRELDNSSLSWLWYMAEYRVSSTAFLCPGHPDECDKRYKLGTPAPPGGWPASYPNPVKNNIGFNFGANKAQYGEFTWAYHIRVSRIKYPSNYMFIVDLKAAALLTATDFVSTGNTSVSYPHNIKTNFTFGDGHLASFKYPTPFGGYFATFPNGSTDSRLWTGE